MMVNSKHVEQFTKAALGVFTMCNKDTPKSDILYAIECAKHGLFLLGLDVEKQGE